METTTVTVTEETFGQLPDGRPVTRFRLRNPNGMEVETLTYGAIIRALWVPDRNGNLGDVVLGFDSLSAYLHPHPYMGAMVGRYANRIKGARFLLDDQTYELAANDGPNHLHSGLNGFARCFGKLSPSRTGAPRA